MTIDVYDATGMSVVDGVQIGDTLGLADEMVLDDVYALLPDASLHQIDLVTDDTGLRRATGNQNAVHLDCCLTLMAPDGSTHDALVLVEESGGVIAAMYLMPLGDIASGRSYRLVGITRQTVRRRFAESFAGSFARGTRITLANGQMQTIEDLTPDTLILTRDAGKQPLRHIHMTTLRATGPFAPVVIAKGVMHNHGDLVVRPDHRLFVYQRRDLLGAGRAEVLVKARDLVDGAGVQRRQGGFIDYYQLVFDAHHIIYAEGIAAESYLVDARTKQALPREMHTITHGHQPHMDYDVTGSLLDPQKAAALLRRASNA